MISSKFLHDDGEEDEVFIGEWASSGGVSPKDLVRLEKEFLDKIQWEIFVSEHKFWKKLGEIETIIARNEGIKRGWFTYVELQNLLVTVDIANLIECVTTIISILTATYALGILALLGSVFIASNIPGNYLHNRNVNSAISIENGTTSICETTTDSLSDVFVGDDCSLFKNRTKQLDAVDVLKTGILLASIKTTEYSKQTLNKTDADNSNSTPWAWWSNPAMNWLTESSALFSEFIQIPQFKYYTYRYRDEPIVNFKILHLEDQIHKATKVRIQDQLEQSWHIEWTDTLRNLLFRNKLLSVIS